MVANGVGLTPAMGYNTWNDMRCDGKALTAERILSLADRLISSGLKQRGFVYLNIDDCWMADHLDIDGGLIAKSASFPNGGIRAIADALHGRGLKLGLYSSRGFLTCAGLPASSGHERLHARQFAAWGVDYLKYDSCYASQDHEVAFAEYKRMRDALNATGRPILYSLSGWNAWYAYYPGTALGNSWRIAADCDTWANVYLATRTNELLGAFAQPGAFNDPDMLLGSGASASVRLTPAQVQAQFSLWAVMASPLLIGASLLDLPSSDLAVYTNEEVIAVNQDVLGRQGIVVWQNCPAFQPRDNFWLSPWSMPLDVAIMWTQGLAALIISIVLLALAARLHCRHDDQPALGESAQRDAWSNCCRVSLLPRFIYARVAGLPAAADGDDSQQHSIRDSPSRRHERGHHYAHGCGGSGSSAVSAAFLCRGFALMTSLLCAMAIGAIWAYRPQVDACQQIWARQLAHGAHAIVLVNFAPTAEQVVCDEACLKQATGAGSSGATTWRARDLIAHVDLDPLRKLKVRLDGNGGSAIYRVTRSAARGD